jgi:hypothetical protein
MSDQFNRSIIWAVKMQAVGARASGSAVAFTPGVKASHRCHKAASAGLRSSSTRHQVMEPIQPQALWACGLMARSEEAAAAPCRRPPLPALRASRSSRCP